MPHLDDAPYINDKLIREVVSQYFEWWCNGDAPRQYNFRTWQCKEWMHEALVGRNFFACHKFPFLLVSLVGFHV
jgi:hypothetical protein